MTEKYSGADWIKSSLKIEPSELGCQVADILGQVFRGIYHIEKPVQKVDWTNKRWIEICLFGSISTFDFQHLTELVILCHDRCVRLEITGAAPKYLRLMFHQRKREGNMTMSHPTIDQAINGIHQNIGLGIVGEIEIPEKVANDDDPTL